VDADYFVNLKSFSERMQIGLVGEDFPDKIFN